ncbi:MAG TPA: T9SS type A sorting domain-containing protein [Bacteroidia bacterium]|jgi:hypothetical protein
MKKITLFLLTAFTAINVSGQVTVQSEDFTAYTGMAATVPAGWTFGYNGNYTSTQSAGTSGPNSYKFGANDATITSPMFTLADSLSFWMKGNSTDTLSTLYVMESPDNVSWDTIAVIRPINTAATGMTLGFPVSATSHYIGFTYFKSLGNVAFDDYRLFVAGATSINKNTTDLAIHVSPNPSAGMFRVNVNNSVKALLTVYNITGAIVFEKTITNDNQLIDLSAEANGSYFMTVKTEKETITKKLIINK